MKRYVGLVMAVAVILFVGCATTPDGAGRKVDRAALEKESATTPDWVMKGAGAFKKEDHVFYGRGRATSEIKDEALREEAADNRARADLARAIETYSEYLMEDYASNEEGQKVEHAVKTVARRYISGAQIIDRWVNKQDGTMFSLV